MQSFGKLNALFKRLFEVKTEGDEPVTIGEESFASHWGWFLVLDNLSNSDRTKWDYFLNMNIIEFLNTLCFYKDKQAHERELIRKANVVR